MSRLRSIRWRLQLWQGLLLTLVLGGFVLMAWRLERASMLQRVDQALEERIAVVAGMTRSPRPSPDRPFDPQAPRGRLAPLDVRLQPKDQRLFEGGFYFAVWRGEEDVRSESAPADLPKPVRSAGQRSSRLRGTLRERIHFAPPVDAILVGRDISAELAAVRRTGWLLTLAGAVILLLAQAGGWWITARALSPVRDISRAATRIAGGDLGERIRTSGAVSELAGLVAILNETFARLQAGFTRQARFTADASHELRTPVTVVLTQTQTALSRERTPEEYRESLEACRRAAQRMRRLVDSLLTLARLDSDAAAPRRTFPLDEAVREAAEMLRPIAEEAGIGLSVEAEPLTCRGSAEQIEQVVSNLVGNAVAYNKPGGGVRVSLRRDAGAAVLEVADTGQGIPAESLPHIFERFYRADPTRSGASGRSGLGLAIAKAIVDAHGGTIAVASEPGRGSTFTVRLPI